MGELQRFEKAQIATFKQAMSEIKNGRKASHWMWFIFPQMEGLGRSDMAQYYGIRSLSEAKDYLAHPVLGERLRTAVRALQELDPGHTAEQIFGTVDANKLRSCLTLFIEAGGGPPFEAALERWFSGEKDAATLRIIAAG